MGSLNKYFQLNRFIKIFCESAEKKVFLFFLIILFSQNSNSQTVIKGRIVDNDQNFITFSVLELLKPDTITVFNTLQTDTLGYFYFETKEDSLFLLISSFGFIKKLVPVKTLIPVKTLNLMKSDNGVIDLGNISLEFEYKNITEVAIVANKKLIERKIDRIVFNVENSVFTQGGTLLELLGKNPMLRVSQSDITMIGKSGAHVMINNKMIYLSSEDVINFLSTISSDEIKQIEIITNPSSSHDAEGNSGIINIITKKKKTPGLNGNVSHSYTQAFYATQDLKSAINYRRGKINVFGNGNIMNGSTRPVEHLTSNYSTVHMDQYDYRKKHNSGGNLFGGFDFDINDKSAFSMLYSYTNNNVSAIDRVKSNLSNSSGVVDSVISTFGVANFKTISNSVNANYITYLDTNWKKKINVDLDYFNYTNDRDRNLTMNKFINLTNNEFKAGVINVSSYQAISVGTFKFDFDTPFRKYYLSMGCKGTIINSLSDNSLTFTYIDAANNSIQNNVFKYRENTEAVYFSAKRQFEKFEFQVGLRGEQTIVHGLSESTNEKVYRNYFKLFPTTFFMYKLNSNNYLTLSYGKRIGRPGYYELNPFRTYTTQYNYSEGNPFLLPTFSHNLELSYTLKDKYIFTLFNSNTINYFSQAPIVQPDGKTIAYYQQNIGNIYSFGTYMIIPFKVASFWEGSGTMYLYNYNLKSIYINQSTITQNVVSFNFNNQFRFGKNKKLVGELSAYLVPPGMREGLYKLGGIYLVNAGLKYNFLNKKALLSFGINDIFHLASPRAYITTPTVDLAIRNRYDTRNFRIAFTYKFGNKTLSGKRERETSNTDEKGRVK